MCVSSVWNLSRNCMGHPARSDRKCARLPRQDRFFWKGTHTRFGAGVRKKKGRSPPGRRNGTERVTMLRRAKTGGSCLYGSGAHHPVRAACTQNGAVAGSEASNSPTMANDCELAASSFLEGLIFAAVADDNTEGIGEQHL